MSWPEVAVYCFVAFLIFAFAVFAFAVIVLESKGQLDPVIGGEKCPCVADDDDEPVAVIGVTRCGRPVYGAADGADTYDDNSDDEVTLPSAKAPTAEASS